MVDYWRYELIPKRSLSAIAADGPRHGALIRVDGGFADIHPWPELGDAPLDEQLALLARGETTNLTRASLEFAAIDAAARRDGRSLFEGLTIPPSHWPGPDPPDVFDTAKLKIIDRIPDRVRLRIDFNATLTPDEFVRIAATLPHERIDFIEDPCPYDAATWSDLRAQTGMRLALDRVGGVIPTLGQPSSETTHPQIESPSPPRTGEKVPKADEGDSVGCQQAPLTRTTLRSVSPSPHSSVGRGRLDGAAASTVSLPSAMPVLPIAQDDIGFEVLIIKPAFQKIPNIDAEIIVTSYMDHPIGQLCAAYAAAKAGVATTCGLITHVLYENDPFIERMQIDGTRLVPPGGTGWGFDDLLEKLPWRAL